MRGGGSVAIIALVGCASGPKPLAPVEGNNGRQTPPVLDASSHDPRPANSRAAEPSPSTPPPEESPAPPTPSPPRPSSPPPTAERRPTAAETRECVARGGTIQPVCMIGELTCVVRYRDGGKRCSDKRECIGECLYEGPDPAPPKATGSCQRTSDPCGCKAPIHHGHAEPALCAD